MALEDFTTYSETDPNSDITVAANSITVDTMRRDANSNVHFDYPAGTFTDFVHTFKLVYSAQVGASALAIIWGLTATGNYTYGDMDTANEGVCLFIANNAVYIYDAEGAVTDNTASLGALPLTLYVRVQRNGTTLIAIIYSDEAMTTVLDTITVTCSTDAFSTIIPVGSRESASDPTHTISFVVENLDLQFAASSGGVVTVRTGDGIKARSSSITPPVQQARKPYLHLKSSMKDFFTEHVRFIKTLNLKESVFEKPYLDIEYPSMHLSIPAPDWPTWDKFKPKPGDWPAGGFPVNKGTAPNCPAGGCLLYADWTTSQNDCEKVPVEIHAAVWCTFYPADSRDCVMKIWAKVGKIKEVVYPGGLQAIGPSIDAFVDPSIDLHLICGSMIDGVGHYCEECIEVVCKCNCDSVTNMTLDGANTDITIAPGSTATITVKDGCGPFSWSVSGMGYVLDAMSTEGRANRITCIAGACGVNFDPYVTVTVTDACLTVVTKQILNTAGHWATEFSYGVTFTSCNNCGGACLPTNYGVATYITEGDIRRWYFDNDYACVFGTCGMTWGNGANPVPPAPCDTPAGCAAVFTPTPCSGADCTGSCDPSVAKTAPNHAARQLWSC